MDRFSLRVLQAGVIAVVLLAVLFLGCSLFPSLKPLVLSWMASEVGATWTGAVGTVATLVGTIWIASAETRAKKADALAVAMVHAASTRGKIADAVPLMEIALEMTRQQRPLRATFLRCAAQVDTIELWTAEELIPFSRLPKRCASRLALARENIILVRRIFGNTDSASDHWLDVAASNLTQAIQLSNIGAEALDDIMKIDIEEHMPRS